MMTAARAVLVCLALALALAACSSPIDSADLEPVGDYQSWKRLDVTGPVPAHGDTYRILYANEVAASWPGAGLYAPGTVVVKEIRALDGDGPGELDYIAVARKLEVAPGGGELHNGWLFTYVGDTADVGVDETYLESCWSSCHAAAPFDGLFHDLGN